MQNIYKNRKSFTLAEVLVTLAVIGVIAALTIPGLLKDYQIKQNRVAFKKIYSDLASATKMIMLDNERTMVRAFFDDDLGWGGSDVMRDKYLNYMSSIKKCDKDEAVGGCWPTSYEHLDGSSGAISSIFSRAIIFSIPNSFNKFSR